MKRALIPAVVALGLGVILFFQLAGQGATLCKVCVTFEGVRKCATARAPTEEEARAGAKDSACSLVAHGPSNAMACQRLRPDEASCEHK